jgi:hypothetical protein
MKSGLKAPNQITIIHLAAVAATGAKARRLKLFAAERIWSNDGRVCPSNRRVRTDSAKRVRPHTLL